MDRAAKIALLLWACVALVAQTVLSRVWTGFPTLVALTLVASASLVWLDRRAIALLLLPAYAVPTLVRLTFGTWDIQFYPLWIAMLLGAIVPDGLRQNWHVPARWRGPLLCGTLTVAIAAPLIVAREVDFTPALLARQPFGALSTLPHFFAAWSIHVAVTLVVGVLWFDWLLGVDLDLSRWVLAPLGVSLLGLALVSAYQLFVDISFLNQTVYAVLGRAGGTMNDANVAGVIAAMGLGGALWAADRARGWWTVACAVLVALLWMAVWASGSRTALAAAVIVTAGGGYAFGRSRVNRLAPGVWLLAGGVLILLVVLAASGLRAVGPVRRVWETLPSPTLSSVKSVAAELWNRNGYGRVSTHLIRRFPWSGIGIGSFHHLGPPLDGTALPPDNAQNWYRHQVVELGWLGSAGWLAFVALFGWAVVRSERAPPVSALMARSILVAFAVISCLGVPTQEPAAAIMFWTAAAWYVSSASLRDREFRPVGRASWALIGVLLVAFAASTLHTATTSLRLPVRARAIGWPFSYGFYWPEPDGAGGEQRWASRRAVALVDVPAPFMTLTVHVNHADLAAHPVEAKVWVEGRLVLETRLTSGEPARVDVLVPKGLKRTLVETWVSRVVTPRALGVDDGRELGLLVSWRFSDRPETTKIRSLD